MPTFTDSMVNNMSIDEIMLYQDYLTPSQWLIAINNKQFDELLSKDEQIEQLEIELEDANDRASEYESQVDDLELDVRDLRDKCDELENDLEEITEKYNRAVKALEEKVAEQLNERVYK